MRTHSDFVDPNFVMGHPKYSEGYLEYTNEFNVKESDNLTVSSLFYTYQMESLCKFVQ